MNRQSSIAEIACSHTYAAVSSRVFGLREFFIHEAVSSRVFGLRVFFLFNFTHAAVSSRVFACSVS